MSRNVAQHGIETAKELRRDVETFRDRNSLYMAKGNCISQTTRF